MDKNNDLIKVFEEANKVTYERMSRMDEIYVFLLKNKLFPIPGAKLKKTTNVSSKKQEKNKAVA